MPATRTMATGEEQDIAAIRAIAEGMLSVAFGGPVRLDDGAPLPERSVIFRFALLDAPAGSPVSVVVKGPSIRGDQVYDPQAGEFMAPARRLFDEWAGLEFLSQVMGSDSPAPRFYAGSREKGLIAIEDLSDGTGLEQLLLGGDPAAAEEALLGLAAELGRMHGRTFGRQAQYDRLRDALGPRPPAETHFYEQLAEVFADACALLDVAPAAGAEAELKAVIAGLSEPGPFLAFVHSDPCPDNVLWTGAGIRLIDFEFGGYRHALHDGVYGRMHFPTCWCVNRLPTSIPQRMEALYRRELAEGCPAARDDALFYRAVSRECVNWALTSAAWGPLARLLEEDQTWGIATMRQRVLLRFGVAAATTAETGQLEALGATLESLAARLRSRWPEEAASLPLYPAFR